MPRYNWPKTITPMYSSLDLKTLAKFYENELLSSTIPFWFPRSIDHEHGGFLLMRDEDGSLIDDDKAVWHQGRATWLLATLYLSLIHISEPTRPY